MEKDKMENLSKIATVTYYACGVCQKKMDTVTLGGSSDLFSFGSHSKAMFCNNKECENFGFLTVVGIKKEE